MKSAEDMAKKATPCVSGARVADSAAILGDVTLETGVNIWYGSVLRGDEGKIVVGKHTNIQDCCVLHGTVTLGSGCTVGHRALLHGCTIGSHCMIGMGAIILDGAKLGEYCFVAAGSLVTGKTDAPPYSFLMGSPARIVGTVSEEQLQYIERNCAHYCSLAESLPLLK